MSVNRQNNEHTRDELIVAQLPRKLFVRFRTAGSFTFCARAPSLGLEESRPRHFFVLRFIRCLRKIAGEKKAAVCFVMAVRPFAWNNSASNGRIFMKFDI